ncbi:MAG: glycosyltransferase family 2 protein [Bacteroidota bacterium]
MGVESRHTVSVLIPTFNSGGTLSIALQSIVAQTYDAVEVVIMDGASSDDTLEVAESFRDRLPGLKVYSEKDSGVYDAMNKAMVHATGDWIIFLGSDDRFYNAEVLAAMATHFGNSTAKVLYGNVAVVGDAGWAADGTLYDGPFDTLKLLNKNICHQAIFYQREFVAKLIGNFSLKYPVISDWDFNLRCWARAPFEYVDLTICYFVAGGVSTHGRDVAFAKDRIENIIDYFAIDVFDPLIDTPEFACYPELVRKQQKEHPIRYQIRRFQRKFKRK